MKNYKKQQIYAIKLKSGVIEFEDEIYDVCFTSDRAHDYFLNNIQIEDYSPIFIQRIDRSSNIIFI